MGWRAAHRGLEAERNISPGRVCLLACLGVAHAGVLLWLALPHRPQAKSPPIQDVERLQVVEVAHPVPPPPPGPVPGRRPPTASTTAPARSDLAIARDEDQADVWLHDDRWSPPDVSPSTPGAARGFGAPDRDAVRPLRGPVGHRLPGSDEVIIDGIHVRQPPSVSMRVATVTGFLFGAPQNETCADVRQRLLGAPPGRARDMDVERLRRLCRD